MQIKSKYWKNNGEYNINDPGDDNIMLGGRYFVITRTNVELGMCR